MVTSSEIFDGVLEDAGLASRPDNPPSPPQGDRKTYVLTFDNGDGDTEGMLDCLREASVHAISFGRLPRTTIICRTAASEATMSLLDLIAGNLLGNGSAMVVLLGSSDAYVWPDRPWKKGRPKSWVKIVA